MIDIIVYVECCRPSKRRKKINRSENSDAEYIKKINGYYFPNHKIKIMYLGGKSGFKNAEIIRDMKVAYNNGSTIVICLDKDDSNNADQVQLSEQAIEFCKSKNYNLCWFNENIENVLIGKSDKNKKTANARKFKINDQNCNEIKRSLSFREPGLKLSNYLLVMNDLINKV